MRKLLISALIFLSSGCANIQDPTQRCIAEGATAGGVIVGIGLLLGDSASVLDGLLSVPSEAVFCPY